MPIGSSPREDIAWAAGLFEGEGCITNSNHNPRLALAMTDLDVVEKFQRIVGVGKVAQEKRSKVGLKDIWCWRTGDFEYVQAVLAAFWPWLHSRRRARAIEMLALGAKAGRGLRFRSFRHNGNRCRAGHEMTTENTRMSSGGYAVCRQCNRERARAYKLKRRAQGDRHGVELDRASEPNS